MNPYHFVWSWSYTLISLVSLLALFAIAGAVLLLRRPLRRWHRSPDSISTPLGLMSEHQAKHEWPWGVRRASEREYHLKGRE